MRLGRSYFLLENATAEKIYASTNAKMAIVHRHSGFIVLYPLSLVARTEKNVKIRRASPIPPAIIPAASDSFLKQMKIRNQQSAEAKKINL